ncbi:hypothetical protein SAMN04487972_11814 [Paracoccus halophilus]|uniref:Uncharacterized protein n=1 Tax=Paracoccus halophilus TaxID=376733 RepID=A0A099EZ98_9RHOB|nr:hypothetical protein [Paracoccus halophilus]KGJ03504.1 hypothetical protein IT41_13725 [Paracoccus halophilus]SFA57697.1 hypothetical protein SAMN04487972_11814 [Paracoccus halophilus]
MTRPFRRRILYIPGFDPIPPRRYRELYRREGTEQARISGYRLAFGPRRDRKGFGWAVSGVFGGQQTEAEFEVLVWADIVQESMGQSIPATYGQLLRTAWAYIGSGALWRLMRLRRGPVIAALYPVVVLLAQLALALAAGAAIGWVLGRLTGLGAWLGLPVTLAVAWAGLRLWRRLDGRIFAYYLMHDYAFTAQHGGAYPPALEARLARFTDRIAEVLTGDWDEVLVVGHSSGAYLGVSVLADLARSGRVPAGGPRLGFLTLGHVVPMASFLPRAKRLRADLRDLSMRGDLDWIDVTAPGDACSFGLCDPVAVSGIEPEGRRQPLVLSAAFSQSLSAGKRRSLRGRWFRLHFQYLCAFDRPGSYDYFAITAGPRSLRDRFAGRQHSPGRIARPVNRWTAT